MSHHPRFFTRIALCGSLLLAPALASAAVDYRGDWPSEAATVSLDFADMPKTEALLQLGRAAGWNMVVRGDLAGHERVNLHVTDEDPRAVLDAMLGDTDVTVKRSGKLVEVIATTPTAPAAPAAPPQREVSKGSDRTVIGKSLRIEKDETVKDVAVTGGSLDVYGHVTGDLLVTGGSAVVHAGGVVDGDALAVGGRIHVEEGGRIGGEGKVIGGVYTKGQQTLLSSSDTTDDEEPSPSVVARAASALRDALSSFSLLFVIGALFLAAAPERMSRLRVAVVQRPVAQIAYGLVGLVCAVVAGAVLCITLVGIPFVVVGALLAALATSASLAALLTTAGEAVLAHRSKNMYVHLAAGSAAYALLGLVPWIGGWVQLAVFLAAVGCLVTTRVAGFFERKTPHTATVGNDPYRSAI